MWYRLAKTKLKIIFLDFDGVLNNDPKLQNIKNQDYFKIHNLAKHIYKNKISLVNKIVEQTGAKIIISSSWRLLGNLKAIEKELKDKGLKAEIIDSTSKKGKEHDDRWKQIKSSIEKHKPDTYVIIDDDHISTREDFSNPYFIKTKDKLGITEKDVEKIINILNEEK